MPGLASAPVLDGDGPDAPAGETCSTASCAGAVLSVPAGEYAAVTGITIADGDTATTNGGEGGGLDVAGTVTVSGSTFAGNTASVDGGAVDSGDHGGGSVTVTASTFSGNAYTYGEGGTIAGGVNGAGSVAVAADAFSGSCNHAGGTWDDAGYNAGSDFSCLAGSPGDVDAGSVAALGLGALASNGGPTQAIMPQPGSAVTGIIPSETTVSLPGGQLLLCPDYDQRGYYVSAPGACDAGAVQATGLAPVKLADSATSTGFYQAGDQVTYRYKVTNTDSTTLFGAGIDDPAVPGAACPDSSLAPGAAETCTGSYTVTAADVKAGKVTDTATATATTVFGNVVLSGPATVTVRGLWPASVTGTPQPAAGAAEGYYLGVSASTWTLKVTRPGTGQVPFTGTITINTGKITGLTPISLPQGSSAQANGKTLTFTITSHGQVNGFRFTAQTATSLTLTLKVNGTAATASQIHLGTSATKASSPSPITFTR